MQSTLSLQKVFPFIKGEGVSGKTLQQSQIADEINEVLLKISWVRSRFDFEVESDIIDSLIYEERALLSRYKHLITLAKDLGVTSLPRLS